MSKFLSRTGKHKLEAQWFYCIFMTESAYLILKIRCECVLEQNNRDQWHSAQEIKSRCHDPINKRLTLDQATTHKIYEKKAVAAKVVLCTWSDTKWIFPTRKLDQPFWGFSGYQASWAIMVVKAKTTISLQWRWVLSFILWSMWYLYIKVFLQW